MLNSAGCIRYYLKCLLYSPFSSYEKKSNSELIANSQHTIIFLYKKGL